MAAVVPGLSDALGRRLMDDEDYTPDKIEYYLEHWRELQNAAEGGTGSLGGGGAGRGDRLALACLIADLERAADDLPWHWTGTYEVLRLQARPRQRRPNMQTVPLQTAIVRMARGLGWSEA